jgi:hypothetical protein
MPREELVVYKRALTSGRWPPPRIRLAGATAASDAGKVVATLDGPAPTFPPDGAALRSSAVAGREFRPEDREFLLAHRGLGDQVGTRAAGRRWARTTVPST